jgi:hypothetical protein
MKYTACFLLANIFYLSAFCCYAASHRCDPSQPCKSKADTAAKKVAGKATHTVPAIQPVHKPTAKKDDKKIGGDPPSHFSWRPTFIY